MLQEAILANIDREHKRIEIDRARESPRVIQENVSPPVGALLPCLVGRIVDGTTSTSYVPSPPWEIEAGYKICCPSPLGVLLTEDER